MRRPPSDSRSALATSDNASPGIAHLASRTETADNSSDRHTTASPRIPSKLHDQHGDSTASQPSATRPIPKSSPHRHPHTHTTPARSKMRLGSPFSLLLTVLAGQGLLSGVLAAPPTADAPAGHAVVPADVPADAPVDGEIVKPPPKTAADALPEVLELTGTDFHEKTKKGYWFVKHYSPTCMHCQAAAPIWKEVANHYSTLDVSATSGSTFAEMYDFEFGSLNCLAYGDLCGEELKIERYPTFTMYKDGKPVDVYKAPTNDYENLSKMVDKWLGVITKEKIEGKTLPAKPAAKVTPNVKGESMALDSEAFTKLITTTRDAWFVKFYAPWCGHCQAMGPAWGELGREMKGLLNIGEVNCEIEKRLCKDIKLRGYPTILYFQNGERVEYDGLRGLGDLVNFARKAVDSGVKEVDDAKFKELEKSGDMEVAFVYFYDHAAVSEDFEAMDRLTLNLIGHAPLYKTKDDDMAKRFRVYTRPKFMVVRDGKPSYYNALAPHDLRDYNRVLSWMKSVWLPIVPELTAANSHEIMNKKIVVLGILSRDRTDEFAAAKKELKEAAVEFMLQRQEEETAERKRLRDQKQLRLEEAEDRNDDRGIRAAKGTRISTTERQEVGFAWVDGVFWERWVRSTYGVNVNADGARIIINDEDRKQYWDLTVNGEYINTSRSRILDTLRDVLSKSPNIRSKSTTTRINRAFFLAKASAHGHPWMSITLLVVALLALAFFGRRRMKRKAGGFFKLDGKEGLLGGQGQGKVD